MVYSGLEEVSGGASLLLQDGYTTHVPALNSVIKRFAAMKSTFT